MSETDTPGWFPDVQRIVERLTELLGRESVSEDYVRLRIEVFKAQAAVLGGLADSTIAEIPGRARRPGPTVAPEMMPFDAVSAERLFDAIAQALRQHGDPGAGLTRLESAAACEPGLLERLMRRAAFGPDEAYLTSLGERLEVSAELLLFLGRLLAAPFVTYAAGRLHEQRITANSSDGPCPACGSTPGLASLRPDDGRRVLHCSLCGHRWPFDRLVCPFCTSRDQPALTRLAVAEDDAHWIEACDECKHYLKVIDRRLHPDGRDFIALAEEVAGLFLDLVAEKEGYLRKPPYAAVG